MAVKIKLMWEWGPLRLWSPEPYGGMIQYASGGFVGSYVCHKCQKQVPGVYEAGNGTWICAGCREQIAGKGGTGGKKPHSGEVSNLPEAQARAADGWDGRDDFLSDYQPE